MKVAVVGSREKSWANPQRVRDLVRVRMMELVEDYAERMTFISGHAPSGVDFWAEEYATAAGCDFIPFPAA